MEPEQENNGREDQCAGFTSHRERVFLRLDACREAFGGPLIFLVFFVFLSWHGYLDNAFPWAQVLGLLIVGVWSLRALSHLQERIATEPLFVLPDSEPLGVLSRRQAKKVAALRAFLSVSTWDVWSLLQRRPSGVFWERAGQIILVFFVCTGWVLGGEQLLVKINPRISAQWQKQQPVLHAWIASPDYMGLPPQMIATPSGAAQKQEALKIVEGSEISVHMPGEGQAPVLQVNGGFFPLERDAYGDYATTQKIEKNNPIALSRGHESLGFWRVKLIQDTPPTISFTTPPVASEQKTVRIAYKAEDDQAVKRVTLIVMSTAPEGPSIEVPLLAPEIQQINETIFPDLTSNAMAGSAVILQLRVEDGAGQVGTSGRVSFKLPERQFTNPLSQALIEERRQLLNHNDAKQRDEAAGVMAGIAHQKNYYHDDQVVLMALRSGAMRLVLNPSPESLQAVTELIWQSAVRIEEGSVGLAREALRLAQSDCAAALDRKVSPRDMRRAIDHLSQVLTRYLDEVAARLATARDDKAGEIITLELKYQDQTLTPGDLLRLLEEMRGLVDLEDRPQLREKLVQIQQITENFRPQPLVLSPEQKKLLLQFRSLKKISDFQKKLHEDTQRAAGLGKNDDVAKALALKQQKVLSQLRDIIGLVNRKPEKLQQSLGLMQEAIKKLEADGPKAALPEQEKALQALRQGMMFLLEGLPDGMVALPRRIMGRNVDESGVDRARTTP